MIAVIDTNHLLRIAAAMKRSPLFAAWRNGRFEIAISQAILTELERVRYRPKVLRFVPPENLTDLIAFFQTDAVFVIPVADFPRCRDPKDDMIIATAIAAHADFIVTTDHDLLDDADLRARLHNEWNLRVAEPADFLAALG
jgi:hypothetical protein